MSLTSCRFARHCAAAITAVAALCGITGPAHAAAISDAEFEHLLAAATPTTANAGGGGVHIAIKLAHITFADADGGDPAKMASLRSTEQALLRELGPSAWPEGRWNGGLGVIGLYIDVNGLRTLRASNNALSFSYAVHSDIRSHRYDPRFVALERELTLSGYADVFVQMRSETAVLDITPGGVLKAAGGMAARQEHTSRTNRVLNALRSEDVANLAQAKNNASTAARNAALNSLDLSLRINAKALVGLATQVDVASVRLAATPETPRPEISAMALQVARETGRGDVIIAMQNPMRQARENGVELKRRADAQTRAFADVMRIHSVVSKLTSLPALGAFTGHLTLAELERLAAGQDARLLGIAHNGAVAKPHLASATARMQMSIPWNRDAVLFPEPTYMDAGYRGAYPSIQGNPGSAALPIHVIVMDGGVFSSSAMLAGKVAMQYGSCFGTFNATHESVCPGAIESNSGTWDTPYSVVNGSVPGAGEPPLAHWYCVTAVNDPIRTSLCDHGTLVAGNAAGRTPPGGPLPFLRGTAPSAKVISLRTWSMPKPGMNQSFPTSWGSDLFAGLQSIVDATNPDTVNNDFVVNISSGTTEAFQYPCFGGEGPPEVQVLGGTVYNEMMVTAVQQLRQRGIPVIVSAGNAQSRNGVAWPACVPGVIKVGAMLNLADVNAFFIPSTNTNLVSVIPNIPGGPVVPYVGEYFFLGSGALGAIGVLSARASVQYPYGRANGTSFASPQITGVYAVVKAAYRKLGFLYNVDWASQWVRDSASVEVTDTFDTAVPQRKHKAVRFSNVP